MLPRTRAAAIVAALALGSVAADFKDVNPNVLGPDDPRTKDLPKMMWTDAKRRMQEANLRESKAFAEVKTREQWTQYRDVRIKALKASLGVWPEVPKDMRVIVSRTIEGDGFIIQNTLYESRPGFWVPANVYLPVKPPEKMPGIIIAHSHHGGKTGGELQDMGMTWARSGVAVLVLDQFGYGERREHGFNTDKDYDKPFRVSRQDYYFRYNSNLQLTARGDSLMGWMVWDLMRGVDVLLKLPTIDPKRIIMMGSVAGGGDPVGVTAALDERIACVVPFNFGGWQPESSVSEKPDRDTPWFGDGYWESTRGLRFGARDGFAHFVIVGSVAPRKVIYAHEFAWDGAKDPAWPRLQKIFGFYDAKSNIVSVFGKGSVRGPGGPDNTHCNHIGKVHRVGIHAALKEWFGIPIPEEYSKPLPGSELRCWTEEARKKLREPATVGRDPGPRAVPVAAKLREIGDHKEWAKHLGNIEPNAKPGVTEGKPEEVPGGTLVRFALEPDPGIVVPGLLLRPKDANGKLPVVVMVAQAGKAAFLKERGDAIEAFLKANVAVCLLDVRGTGETQAGTSASRGSTRTSISQTNLILGQPVIGSQLRDLRTAIRWLQGKGGIDGKRIAVWGDSFARSNPPDAKFKAPLDANDSLAVAEPGGDLLAFLAKLFEDDVKAAYARGGLADPYRDVGGTLHAIPCKYLYVPHEAIIPGIGDFVQHVSPENVKRELTVGSENQIWRSDKSLSLTNAAKWVIERLAAKK